MHIVVNQWTKSTNDLYLFPCNGLKLCYIKRSKFKISNISRRIKKNNDQMSHFDPD
jgi:hypothetical protein